MRISKSKSAMTLGLISAGWLGLAGCTSSSSTTTAASTAVAVSGTLSLANSSQSIEKIHRMKAINGDSAVNAYAVSDYNVVCATTTAPILSGTGTVATDGTFSVSIDGAAGQPMSCYLTDASGENAGSFLIENSAKTNMNGDPDITNTLTPTGAVAMGTVDFDPEAEEATVDAAAVASAVNNTVAATNYDPTGAWTIGAVDFTLPNGVRSTCTATERSNDTCHGPPDGQTIYLKLWSGVSTVDASTMLGLQVWDDATSFAACGSKIGLPTDVKAQIGVDFSANGASDAEFTFATNPTFTDNILSATSSPVLTDNWKMSTATLQHSTTLGCAPSDVTFGTTTYSNAWVCGPDSSTYYQVNLGGGCVKTSDGTSVNVTDWSGINSCGAGVTIDANGVRSQTCTGTATINSASVAVSCSNKWVVATKPSSTYVADTNLSHNFDYNQLTSVASGTACSNGALTGIAQLQCYADYYWRSGLAENGSVCVPKIDTDWSTSDPAAFVKKDFRPSKLVFFDQYKPFPDGSGGAILTRQEHFQGVQVNGNNWVNCRVIETGGLSIKKISDTKLLATYVSSEITTSTSKPACLANYTGAKKTFVFYMTQ